ncbi:MAG: GNAT family N-acetyltransferase [Actinomycetota bacterium]|nr:GNAT family N-acetyltransferase [Actinomycetota bacterium]
MVSITLDSSCALNFLGLREEEPDTALLELLHLGMRHRILVGVTGEAYAEVDAGLPEDQARRQLARLKVFGRLEIPIEREAEVEALSSELHADLFSSAVEGSRSDDHNWRDCRQLAAHKVVGRRVFVTRDQGLLRRQAQIADAGIEVADPADCLASVTSQEGAPAEATGVAVRRANLDRDETAIRKILSPLGDDYPNFEGWLSGSISDSASRIQVAEMDGRVGAVALTKRKDARVWKLAAFMVAPEFRQAGLGGHLLWSEMRIWCEEGLEKVYVTVSSRRTELVAFFTEFGFLLEGASARRYDDSRSELILAKHLISERVEEDELDAFAEKVARPVLASPVPDAPWALPHADTTGFRWAGTHTKRRLEQLGPGDTVVRAWSLLDLERIFHPLTLAIDDRPVLLVPIDKQWAETLIEFPGEQLRIASDQKAQRLLLRPDNAYYCYPTAYEVAVAGTPILFYVTAPVMAIVGEARIIESEIAPPEDLYVRFGGLGVYKPNDIRVHVRRNGPNDGCALALRFAQYASFARQLSRAEMLCILGRPLSGPQGLTPISFKEFEALRRTGIS